MSDAGHSDPRSLAQTGRWLTLAGLAGLVLGLSGLVMVFAARSVGVAGYGALLALLGLVQFAELLRRLSMAGRLIRAILALVYIGCGLTLMFMPETVGSLELLVACLFAAAGVFRIVWALAWPRGSKVWGVAAGLGAIALGAVMLLGWPEQALWVLGAAVAVDLSFYGASALLLGRTLSR